MPGEILARACDRKRTPGPCGPGDLRGSMSGLARRSPDPARATPHRPPQSASARQRDRQHNERNNDERGEHHEQDRRQDLQELIVLLPTRCRSRAQAPGFVLVFSPLKVPGLGYHRLDLFSREFGDDVPLRSVAASEPKHERAIAPKKKISAGVCSST